MARRRGARRRRHATPRERRSTAASNLSLQEKLDRCFENVRIVFSQATLDPWNPARLQAFETFLILLSSDVHEALKIYGTEDCTVVISDDIISFLRQTHEPVICAVWAKQVLAKLLIATRKDFDALFECLEDIIGLCESVSSEDRPRAVVLPSMGYIDVGRFLSECRQHAIDFRSTMNIDAQGYKTDDGKWVPVVPGIICDGCRKHRGSEPFMLCSRCNLAYFCSQDCFAQAWTKGGHKQQCRKEGETKVGDVMALDRSVGEFSCGTNVELIAREVEEHEGHPKPHWFVQPRNNENTGEILKVEERDLRRIRAALWNVYSSELYPRNEFEQNS